MQHQMEDFIRALRAADVRVSPAEAIDAARAAATVGYADRQLFKDALCTTLAKSPDEVVRFDETFETFFTRDPLSGSPPPLGDDEDEEDHSEATQGSELARMLLSGDAAAIAQAMEEAAERAGVTEIRLSTQRSRMTRRLLEEMGLGEIEKIISEAKKRVEAQRLAERL